MSHRPANHVGKSGHFSGKHYIEQAAKHDCEIKNGKGDHVKVWSPDHKSMLVIPVHRSFGTGIECVIKAWFKRNGIPLLGLLGLFGILAAAILVNGG